MTKKVAINYSSLFSPLLFPLHPYHSPPLQHRHMKGQLFLPRPVFAPHNPEKRPTTGYLSPSSPDRGQGCEEAGLDGQGETGGRVRSWTAWEMKVNSRLFKFPVQIKMSTVRSRCFYDSFCHVDPRLVLYSK